jgi:hypothetical protein
MPMPSKSRGNRYGYEHQRLRKAMLPYAVGSTCTRCAKPIEAGQAIDLDHTDDGLGYKGWAHAVCNRKAGAHKRHVKHEPKHSREW